MRRRLLTAITAASLTMAVAVVPQVAHADESVQYVALGDSFAAGSGPYPLAAGSVPWCLQTATNYPHVVAETIGADLHDVSCGGATTAHFTAPQWPGLAPQADALSVETELVTVNIGGNDGNAFAGAIVQCGTLGILSLGFGSPCRDSFGASLFRTIDEVVYPNVVQALRVVHDRAPNAEVYLTGTPWVVPTTWDRSCYLKAPIARGDIPFLRGYQAHLNAAFEKAALETGTTFVDLSEVSDGHDMCKPVGVRWVEPAFGGTNVVHPNPLGMAGQAAQVVAVMRAAG